MKKRKLPILLILGVLLVVASFALVIVFQIRGYIGSQESRSKKTRNYRNT